MFAGDHFYLRGAHPQLLAGVREDLEYDLGPLEPSGYCRTFTC